MNPDRFDPVRSGYSGMGDQTGAKNGTMKTFLQDASDAGARLLPNTRIREVTTDDGAATGVEGVHTDPETGAQTPVRITAPTVVVAAGSLETPPCCCARGSAGPRSAQRCGCTRPRWSAASTTSRRTPGTARRWRA
ncbi:hypothetical protein MTP03_41660 [Tsukamurella sp. PLM1]|nr:hypothetical protein MTP03_41660 [Tsukamurella sp. PLM1]